MNKPVETPAKLATLTGAEAVVEMLTAHGVEGVFGLCGDTSLPLYDAFFSAPQIKHVLTRDERHAAYMADGYARVTGKVGVCEGPSGGGATYILPGLVEANESSVPVLALNTDISVSSRNRYTLTELDQRALMKPLTKWNAVIDRAVDIPRTFRQAFDAMTSGRPGAAHIALPYDVQTAPVDASDVWGDPSLGIYPSRRVAPDLQMVELALVGDAKLALAALIDSVNSRDGDLTAVDEQKRAKFASFEALARSDESPIRPERVVADVSRLLDADAQLVADPGTPCPYFS